MPLKSLPDESLDILEDRIFAAEMVTPELLSEVIAVACERFNALGAATKDNLERLIDAGAWTDAALTLVGLELPRWHLRRLVRDEGEWLCTLSRQPELPIEFNETVETRHDLLPLAVLSALLQAKRASASSATGAAAESHDASRQPMSWPQPLPVRREAGITAPVVVLAALVLFCAGMLAPALWTAVAESTQYRPTSQNCVTLEVAADRHACIDGLSERTIAHRAKGANAPSMLRLSGQRGD